MGLFQDLREVFKSMKHRKSSAKYCPRCGSIKLNLTRSLNTGLGPSIYSCKDCGYRGPIFMELEEETRKK